MIEASSYAEPNRGPYPFNQPKRNQVPFTPVQVEAIRAGMNPGLTMVVGPPGTGKTDVAVQTITNLYHNFPDQVRAAGPLANRPGLQGLTNLRPVRKTQHTLVITHSNQGLNQIFEKIIRLDVDERHCLRLGHGEEDLATEKVNKARGYGEIRAGGGRAWRRPGR